MNRDINYYINLINKEQLHNKSGGNSICYLFEDVVLLYGSIDITNIDRKIKKINDMKKRGINVVPILEYKVDETKHINTFSGINYQVGWTLQKKAKGNELHSNTSIVSINSIEDISNGYFEYKKLITNYYNNIKRLLKVTQEQIDKFVSDYAVLEQSSLAIDPSKASNFFYDTEEGFSFVDIDEKNTIHQRMDMLMEYILLVTIPSISTIHISDIDNKYGNVEYLTIFPEEIGNQLKTSINQLLEKLVVAFKNYGFSKEEIEAATEARLPIMEKIMDSDCYTDLQAIKSIIGTLEEVKRVNTTPPEKSDDDWTIGW